jgi:L-asparagine transporter-like permease
MSLELTHPQYLAGLAFVLVLIWSFRYSLIDFSNFQQWFSFCVRLAILTLIVFALAGLTFLSASREMMVVFLVDQSRSIDSAARKKTQDYLNTIQELSQRELVTSNR